LGVKSKRGGASTKALEWRISPFSENFTISVSKLHVQVHSESVFEVRNTLPGMLIYAAHNPLWA